MTISFRFKGLLSFALAAHHILNIPLPIPPFTIGVLLLCTYALIWASKTHVRAFTAAIARHLQHALAALPHTAIGFYSRLTSGSFYVLLWVLIWGPTSGLPMLLRSVWWSVRTVTTLCCVSTTLSGFLWVPAWCYFCQPSYCLLQRTAKLGANTCRWVSAKVISLLKSCAAAAVSGFSYARQHRPTLSGLARWAAPAVTAFKTVIRWVACAVAALDAGGRSALVVISRAASTAVEGGQHMCTKAIDIASRLNATSVNIASQMLTGAIASCTAGVSWASSKTGETCSTARRLSRRVPRAFVKTVAFFGKEPGTLECVVASTAQILEHFGMGSEVLYTVTVALLGDGSMLNARPTLRVREAVKTTVEIALIAPPLTSNNVVDSDSCCQAAAPEYNEGEERHGTIQDNITQPESTDSLPAEHPVKSNTDEDLDALIRRLATLALSDPDEQPTARSLGPSSSPRIPASISPDFTLVDLAFLPCRASTPFSHAGRDRVTGSKVLRAASSYDSFDTMVGGDSYSSLDCTLDAEHPEKASGFAAEEHADAAVTPEKPCVHWQKQPDLAREVRGAMRDTICAAAIQNAGLPGSREKARTVIDTAAAKHRAWRALLVDGRRCA